MGMAPAAPVRVSFPREGIARIAFGRDGPDSFAVVPPPSGASPGDRAPAAPGSGTQADARLRAAVRPDGAVDVADGDGRPLVTGLGPAPAKEGFALRGSVGAGRSFYGGGERTGFLDKRGESLENWNVDANWEHSSSSRNLYQSHPFVIVLGPSGAFGLLLDTTWRSTLSLDEDGQGTVALAAAGGEARVFVLAGPRVGDVLARLAALTGRMPLPPLWSLGFHQCRWSYHPESRVREVARALRARGIPCDAVWLDIDHMDRYRCFTWNPSEFPDPEGMLADLRRDGFETVCIVDPGVSAAEGNAVWREGRDRGYFVTRPDGRVYLGRVWPRRAAFPDLSREDVRAWWASLNAGLARRGVAGLWNDMNEPAVFNRERTLPLDAVHAAGPHAAVHNAYALYEAEATFCGLAEARPDERPFLLTRAGSTGIQRYAAVWTGDNHSLWEHLLMAVPMLLGLGLSGVPFVGTDVGGFSKRCPPELFARWVQLGAFSPFFRCHNGDKSDKAPWAFGPEVEAIAKRYIRLRYELLPYTYACFVESSETGVPVMRALVIGREDDWAARRCSDQFTWGPDLLVAPVYHPGADHRMVYLPEGAWWDWWTGERHEGRRHIVARAPLDTLPLYAREGSIIPTRGYGASTKEPGDEVTLHVFAPGGRAAEGGGGAQGAAGSPGTGGGGAAGEAARAREAAGVSEAAGVLHEDDGRSLGHLRGEYRRTRFACRVRDGVAEVRRTVEHDGWRSDVRRLVFRIRSPAGVKRVTVDGRDVEVSMEEGGVAVARMELGDGGASADARDETGRGNHVDGAEGERGGETASPGTEREMDPYDGCRTTSARRG